MAEDCYDGDWNDKGTAIVCWSNSTAYDGAAMGTYITENFFMWGDSFDRYNGMTIRPVIG